MVGNEATRIAMLYSTQEDQEWEKLFCSSHCETLAAERDMQHYNNRYFKMLKFIGIFELL